MSKRKSVVVVGPSGSGKSTLVDYLRRPKFEHAVVIPKRVITLPIREDSDSTENRNISEDAFKRERDEGLIKPWWQRDLGDQTGAQHYYGFERVPKHDRRVRVFLGNNALLGSDTKRVHKLMSRSLVVVVTADPSIRSDRLDERLPDMAGDEKARRVNDGMDQLGNFDPLDTFILDTSGQPLAESQQQFIGVILDHAGIAQPAHSTTAHV